MTAPRPSAQTERRVAGAVANADRDPGDPLRWVWLAIIGGLFFVRWWQPTEGTMLGDTLGIADGWFLALGLAGWVGLRGTGWRFRADAWQWAVWLLVAGQIVSGLIVVATTGDRRAALNLMWEWIALGVSFPLLRAALATSGARREWVIVAVGAAVTLSGYGLTQRYWFYPQLVGEYERLRRELDTLEAAGPDGGANLPRIQKLRNKLLGSGLSANMLSGSGRALFEGRLKFSTEALGQFALANTFGGLLLVWWTVVAMLTWQLWVAYLAARSGTDPPPTTAARVIFITLCMVVIGYCLLLTKSRTAYVGSFVGLAGCTLAGPWKLGTSLRQVILWTSIALAATGGLAFLAGLTGGVDRLVISQASKSLQYRLEYWWSSLQAISESPLTGVGPGQFRQHYLAHKLPRSSEEITDPHNLFLDVWANGGLISLLGLSWLVWLLVRSALKNPAATGTVSTRSPQPQTVTPIPLAPSVRESGTPPRPAQKIPQPKTPERTASSEADVTAVRMGGWSSPFRWGALCSLAVVWLMGGGLDTLLLALLLAWLVLIFILDSVVPSTESLPSRMWAAVGVGLLVHLCGAGGIAMPAITQLLLMLCVIGAGGEPTGRLILLQPWQKWGLLWMGLILGGAGYITATQPALNSSGLCYQGDYAQSPATRERAYRLATLADPLDARPWEKLADLYVQRWRNARDRDDEEFDKAATAQRQAIQRNPLSYQLHVALGVLYAERAARTDDADDKMNAVRELQIATARYPHNALLLADAAKVFALGGEEELSRVAARKALQQDDINHSAGHSDKWLTEERRQELQGLAGPS